MILMSTKTAVGTDIFIILGSGATVTNRFFDELDKIFVKIFSLREGKLIGWSLRMDLTEKQSIVGVNIASTGKFLLIKKNNFNGTTR